MIKNKFNFIIVVVLLVGTVVFMSCQSSLPIKTLDRSRPGSKVSENTGPVEPPTEEITPEQASIKDHNGAAVVVAEKDHVKNSTVFDRSELTNYCFENLKKLPGPASKDVHLRAVCDQVRLYDECYSTNQAPIFHYDRHSKDSSKEKRIFVMALIHGDEAPSGAVARSWMERLERLDPRNYWRVIPIANPDGLKQKTRVNVRGVDLNRNFPTAHWNEAALEHWKVKKKEDPRKYPGPTPASEVETQCYIKHIDEFKPDFIISIHTPYGVLDFDGPKMNFPKFKPLPWISLGNYPGSLGRFMWVNNKIPVLTIELKGAQGLKQLEDFDRLQDISGTVAIQSSKIIKKSEKKK